MNRGVLLKCVCVLISVISLIIPAIGADASGNSQNPLGEKDAQIEASGKLSLWYDQPAKSWMTEALPIGNGPLGAMLFGGTDIERVQFNEISLWTGNRLGSAQDTGEDNLGAYQAFGDILIYFGHDLAKVTDYRRELDIDRRFIVWFMNTMVCVITGSHTPVIPPELLLCI